jgi:hypothetical protein
LGKDENIITRRGDAIGRVPQRVILRGEGVRGTGVLEEIVTVWFFGRKA